MTLEPSQKGSVSGFPGLIEGLFHGDRRPVRLRRMIDVLPSLTASGTQVWGEVGQGSDRTPV